MTPPPPPSQEYLEHLQAIAELLIRSGGFDSRNSSL
jgi:hypothetical protein